MTSTKQHPGDALKPAEQQHEAASLPHHNDIAAHNLYLALPESHNSRTATIGDSTEQAAMTAAVRYIRSKTSQPTPPTIPTAPLPDRPPDEPCSRVVEELRDLTPRWAVAAVKGTKGLQRDGMREKLEVMVAARLYIIVLVHGTDGNGVADQDALDEDKKRKKHKQKEKQKQRKKRKQAVKKAERNKIQATEAAEAAGAAEQLQHELAAEEAGEMEVHVTVDREAAMEDAGEMEEQFAKDDTGAESCGDDWEVDYGT